jgi:hypothetical protein
VICPVYEKLGTKRCAACLVNPAMMRGFCGQSSCPEGYTIESPPGGKGDLIHKFALPIAKVVCFPCVDKETGKLKPESRCAEWRRELNRRKTTSGS